MSTTGTFLMKELKVCISEDNFLVFIEIFSKYFLKTIIYTFIHDH